MQREVLTIAQHVAVCEFEKPRYAGLAGIARSRGSGAYLLFLHAEVDVHVRALSGREVQLHVFK